MGSSCVDEGGFSDWECVDPDAESLENESSVEAAPIMPRGVPADSAEGGRTLGEGEAGEEVSTNVVSEGSISHHNDAKNAVTEITEVEEDDEDTPVIQGNYLSQHLHNLQDFPHKLAPSLTADGPSSSRRRRGGCSRGSRQQLRSSGTTHLNENATPRNSDLASTVLEFISSNGRVIAAFGVLGFLICRLNR